MDVPIIESSPTIMNSNTTNNTSKVSQKLKGINSLHFNALKNKTIEEEGDDEVIDDDNNDQVNHKEDTHQDGNGKNQKSSVTIRNSNTNLNRKLTSCDSGVSVSSLNNNAHENNNLKYKKLDNSEIQQNNRYNKGDETASTSSGRSSVRIPIGAIELPGMIPVNRQSPPYKNFMNNSMRSIKSVDEHPIGNRPTNVGTFVRTGSFVYSDTASQIRPAFSDAASIRSLASIGVGSTDGKRMVIRKVPTSPSELMNIINPPT